MGKTYSDETMTIIKKKDRQALRRLSKKLKTPMKTLLGEIIQAKTKEVFNEA